VESRPLHLKPGAQKDACPIFPHKKSHLLALVRGSRKRGPVFTSGFKGILPVLGSRRKYSHA
jgi:hypothetical protein